jgi:biopolymer transport protein ExbD
MGHFRQSSSDDSNETAIDISPLMDCVFILLIFFIVTTTFVEESGVEVDKPQAAQVVSSDKTSITIAVMESGKVLHNGIEIGFGGIQPLVKSMLRTEDVPVVVQAEETTRSGLLVRVVDEARLAGATKVSVSTKQKVN